MGAWFTNYFSSMDCKVSAYDRNESSIRHSQTAATTTASASNAVVVADTLEMCVKDADFVLVCVPVGITPETVRKCSVHMKHGSVIGEISSVKQKTFSALGNVRSDLSTLCLHPMFGPGAAGKRQQKMLLVPVRNERTELNQARRLFADMTLIVISSAREHDKAIGTVLGLTYFGNLVLASLLSAQNRQMLRQVSGTTFKLQSILAESIMADDPALIAALIRDNPQARKQIQRYVKVAQDTAGVLSGNKSSSLEAQVRRLKSRMQKQGDLEYSYRLLYAAVQAIDG